MRKNWKIREAEEEEMNKERKDNRKQKGKG